MTALALLAVVLLAAAAGLLLGRLERAAAKDGGARESVVRSIDALLPQTQCAQCGYPGCRPYAEALADGTADIDRCPPGGERTVRALATLLGREPLPLDTSRGVTKAPQTARIDESECIGCALCLPACPVDAIVGAARFTHTVIEADCTGCELCLPPCPVDCIALVPRAATLAEWRRPAPEGARSTVTVPVVPAASAPRASDGALR